MQHISKRHLVFITVIFPFAIFSIVLSGCASGSKATAEKDVAAKSFTTDETRGIVYLYRPGRAFAGAVLAPIKVNGLDAGGMGPGSYFKWELNPGAYTFSTMIQGSSAVAEVDVQPGKLYFLKMDYNFNVLNGAKSNLDKVDEAEGKKGVEKTKLLISIYK